MHEFGINLTVSYINASDAVTDVSYSDAGITYTGMDGLTLGYGEGDVENVTNTKSNESTMFAKYAPGAATVGFKFLKRYGNWYRYRVNRNWCFLSSK